MGQRTAHALGFIGYMVVFYGIFFLFFALFTCVIG